ncbi:MAG: hypothetical protein RBU27_06245 [Bacteroidota bacterium]|jgi:hypothetical protein|nr:hypothetical protein [Bacteroidota bacterium]
MTDMERERFRMLMMKALDGELAGSEHSEFENFLRTPDCADEWARYQTIKEATMTLKPVSPAPEVWDHYWTGVSNRLERGLAWLLFSLGAAALLAWGALRAAEAVWTDSDVPLLIKIAIYSVAGGLLLLLFSVIRERWFIARHDKYNEVIR